MASGTSIPALPFRLANAVSLYLTSDKVPKKIDHRAASKGKRGGLNTHKSTTTFTRFKELPLEVRLMIWKLAIPGPRIVDLRMKELAMTVGDWKEEEHARIEHPRDRQFDVTRQIIQENYRHDSQSMPGFWSPCLPPALLLVCQESHHVASEIYTKTFASVAGIAETYFDSKKDILYLQCDNFYTYGFPNFCNSTCSFVDLPQHLHVLYDQDFLASIENLALLYYVPKQDRISYHMQNIAVTIEYLLRHWFTGLKKLTLIADHFSRKTDGQQLSLMPPFNIPETLKRDFYYSIQLPEMQEMPELPEAVLLDFWNIAFDMELIKERNIGPLPEIEWKVVVSTELEAEFEATEKRLLEEIDYLSPKFW